MLKTINMQGFIILAIIGTKKTLKCFNRHETLTKSMELENRLRVLDDGACL